MADTEPASPADNGTPPDAAVVGDRLALLWYVQRYEAAHRAVASFLGVDSPDLAADVRMLVERCVDAEKERDRLAGQVQRVRDLATPCTAGPPGSFDKVHSAAILHALDGPAS